MNRQLRFYDSSLVSANREGFFSPEKLCAPRVPMRLLLYLLGQRIIYFILFTFIYNLGIVSDHSGFYDEADTIIINDIICYIFQKF